MKRSGVEASLRVGFAGLGRMGVLMARNIARRGLLAGVYNRTGTKAAALAAEFHIAAYPSPADLAADMTVIATCVSDGNAVHDLYLAANGLLDGARPGTVLLEMSTIGPDAIHALDVLGAERGCELIDAPVSGSIAHADAADLTFMVGGALSSVARLRPVFAAMGSEVFHMGAVGSGSAMKLAVNNVLYGLNQSICESLVLAERAGIDRDRAYEVFACSAAAAPFVHYRRQAFERPGTVPPAMPVVMAEKDLALILAFATSVGAEMPQAALNATLAEAARRAGLADHDITAIAEYLRLDCPGLRAATHGRDAEQRIE